MSKPDQSHLCPQLDFCPTDRELLAQAFEAAARAVRSNERNEFWNDLREFECLARYIQAWDRGDEDIGYKFADEIGPWAEGLVQEAIAHRLRTRKADAPREAA